MRGLDTIRWSTLALRRPARSCLHCLRPRCFCSSSALAAKKQQKRLPESPARTRFAPSPTGFLHLGSLRTALFNFLLARKTGGQFLLRLEDTDQKRTVAGAEERLYEDLKWANLHWDEGPIVGGPYGPYRQSERTSIYQSHAQKLVESGHAYRCFCSEQRLDELARRRKELGLPTDYDRLCASISKHESDERSTKGETHVVRLRAPELYPVFNDLVYGKVGKDKGANVGITFKHGEITYEDPVLLKSDGRPTYHLANVVDDHSMDITHVVRATEWMSSTPKHLALYDAFGWKPPAFAHVGLLVDESGHKLSKRNFATDVDHFRRSGYLPESVINFLALLGWSHERRSDVMDMNELIEQFQMKFTKSNTVVTLEKLSYLQRAHAARAAREPTKSVSLKMLQTQVYEVAKKKQDSDEAVNGQPLESVVDSLVVADAKNYSTPDKFFLRNINFFRPPELEPYENELPDVASTEQLVERGESFVSTMSTRDWTHDNLNAQITAQCQLDEVTARSLPDATVVKEREKQWKKAFCDYLRWALLNGCEGPTLAQTMVILGREVSISRISKGRDFLEKQR